MNLSTVYQSDPSFLTRLHDAAVRGPTQREIHAQKVSFIVSAVNDDNTTITQQDVEHALAKLHGTSVE